MKLRHLSVVVYGWMFILFACFGRLSVFAEKVEVQWPSTVNNSYSILISTNLVNGFSTIASGLQATPPTNTWWMDSSAQTSFFEIRQESVAGNQIQNGDFSDGLSQWTTIFDPSADASLSSVDGVLFADIINGGTVHWHVAIRQFCLSLLEGTDYLIEFRAKAESNRTVRVLVQNANGSSTWFSQDVAISTNWQAIQLEFSLAEADDTARLQLSFGNNNSSVWMDDVILREGTLRDASELLNNRLSQGGNFMAWKAMSGYGAPEDYQLLNLHHLSHCRMGYKLHEFCGNAPDYQIFEEQIQQLQYQVDWCIAEGLIAVIDPLHGWTANSAAPFTYLNDLPKLQAFWTQIAERFASYSTEQLVFEIMNEPHVGDNAGAIISTGLSAIRSQPGNEQRIVIIAGDGFSTRQALIDAFDNDEFPANDPYLIATFHYYDPKSFTEQDSSGSPVSWGTTNEQAVVAADFDEVVSADANWAARNGTAPLPVYMGEFGAYMSIDQWGTDRKRWVSWVRMEAEAHGFSCTYWHLYGVAYGIGPWTSEQQNDPSSRGLDEEMVEALTGRYEVEDGVFSGGVVVSSDEPGFTGAGYTVYPTNIGASVYAKIDDLYIPADGVYKVKIHYASTETRQQRLVSLNDNSEIVDTVISQVFPATGGSNSWATLSAEVYFESGDNASLKIIARNETGVHLDWIHILLP